MTEKTELTRRAAIKRIAEKPEMVNLGKIADLTNGGGYSSKDYGGYTEPVYVDNRKLSPVTMTSKRLSREINCLGVVNPSRLYAPRT